MAGRNPAAILFGMPSPALSCSGCGATLAGTRCLQCGLEIQSSAGGRRAVVIGAAGLSLSIGLGVFALARNGGSLRPGGSGAKSGGTWESDWHSGVTGLKKAAADQKTNKRPMLVYFYADWCGYCRALEANVLSTADGRTALRDVIKVRINAEASLEERQLAGELGVRGYPTLLLVSPDGGMKRIRTPQSSEQLRRMLG